MHDRTSNWLNWIIPIDSSTSFSASLLVKSNSIVMLGVFADADAISVPFKRTLTMPVSQQFPKSSLPRPFPTNSVCIEPTGNPMFQQYQLLQLLMPELYWQSTFQFGISSSSVKSMMLLICSLGHPRNNTNQIEKLVYLDKTLLLHL